MAETDILFKPRTLLKVVQSPAFAARSFLLSSYFRNVRTFTTQSIDIDIVPSGERFVAPFSSPDAGGTLVERKGYRTETFTPALIAPYRVCTAEQLINRLPGEDIYDNLTIEARMARIVADDLAELNRRIVRREEAMAAEALFKGQITISGEGVPTKILKFWDENAKPYTELATPWNEATADPLGDLQLICEQIARTTGRTPDTIICGSKVVRALLDRLGKDDHSINARRVMLGQINPRELADGVQYIGDLSYPNLQILTYSEYHYDEATKTTVPLVPEDCALITCRGAQTTRAYGLIITADQRGMHGVAGSRVPETWMSLANPKGRILRLSSAPLMVVHEPQCFHVIKAVDETAGGEDSEEQGNA